MEEDALEPRGPLADQTEWRRQIAENNYIVASKNVIPTTDMEMNIKVEELQSVKEFVKCMPFKKVKSSCGQTNWTICKQADCYGCYFKLNAV
eukprot:9507111-Heterocapsa_arctica.AAC.1